MSKTVSTETTSEEFNSLHSTVELFSKGLSSLAGTYEEALGQMNLESVDFSNWNDAVKVKLENICDSLKTAKSTISSDISGGSFSRLKTCAESLETLLQECYDTKTSIDSKKTELSNTNKHPGRWVDIDQRPSYQKAGHTDMRWVEDKSRVTSEYSNLKNSIDTLETDLSNKISECNALFTELETIEFNSSTSDGGNTTTGGETSNESPSGENSGEFSPIDSPDGNLYGTSFEFTDEDGVTHQYQMIVNADNGNVLYGNSDEGYVVLCQSSDGRVYAGTVSNGEGNGISNFSSLLTDGHENSNGSNGVLGTFPQNTYGFNNTIDPISVMNGLGNVTTIPVNVGGNTVNVCLPSYENGIINHFSNGRFGGATSGGGSAGSNGVGRSKP